MDVQTIWECGLNDFRVSTDGGQTWQDVEAQTGGSGCMMSFVDDKAGWIHRRRTLQTTTDGGATLTEIDLPEGVKDIVSVSLRTPSDGYLLDVAGVLYVTQDGGQSWSSHSLGLDLETYTILPTADSAAGAIRFTDADHGIVALNFAGGGQIRVLILRTADGGQTWEQESVPAPRFGGVLYLSHDGQFLTLYDSTSAELTVLHYMGN